MATLPDVEFHVIAVYPDGRGEIFTHVSSERSQEPGYISSSGNFVSANKLLPMSEATAKAMGYIPATRVSSEIIYLERNS